MISIRNYRREKFFKAAICDLKGDIFKVTNCDLKENFAKDK